MNSSLPPLNPNSTNNSDLILFRLKKDVQRALPRMQGLENEIENIRSQLPIRLAPTLNQMRHDLDEILGQQSVTDVKIDDESFENSYMEHLDQSLFMLISPLRQAIAEYSPPPEVPIEREEDQTFERRIKALQDRVHQQNKTNSERIDFYQKKLSEINNSTLQFNSQSLVASIDQNRMQIARLQEKISQLEEDLQKPVNYIKKTITTESGSSNEMDSSIPDLTVPLSELREQYTEFTSKFIEELEKAKQAQSLVDDKIDKINQGIDEAFETTTLLQSRLIETDRLCSCLIEQSNDIAKKVGDNKKGKMISDLTMQIRNVHASMRADLDEIQRSVRSTESSQPLLHPH